MRNAHPSVRSMVISVFHFTLHGSMVQALDPSFYSGPFLTYLREDDDYETFLQRLMRVSGDVELISSMRTRLAVVHPQKLTPDFIPRPVLHGSASSVAAGMVTRGTDDSGVSAPATSSNGANGKSLYQRFADVYPEYAAGAETTYEMSMMNTSLQAAARRSQGHSSRNTPAQPQQQWHTLFPALGIQRSVTDMQQVYTAHLTKYVLCISRCRWWWCPVLTQLSSSFVLLFLQSIFRAATGTTRSGPAVHRHSHRLTKPPGTQGKRVSSHRVSYIANNVHR